MAQRTRAQLATDVATIDTGGGNTAAEVRTLTTNLADSGWNIPDDGDPATFQVQPSEGAFVDGDKTKLDGIEAGADVTDAANVTAAGAVMDSEVTNLAAVKAFDPTDYATAAQGSTADSALQPGANATVLDGTAWRLFYTDASGDVTELAFGTLGQVLKSNGASSAPSFEDESGGGISNVVEDTTPQLGGDLDTQGNSITGGFVMPERADHAVTPAAGFGEVWISNGATQTLIFTDDAGTDNEVLTSGSGSTLTDRAAVSNDKFVFFATADSDNPYFSNDIVTDLGLQLAPSEGAFVDGDKTKLDGIEALADVTDAANVAAAGAVMDGDFSTNGFLRRTGAGAYAVSATIDLTSQVSGDLPVADGGTGASDGPTALTNLGGAALGANEFTGTQDFNGQQVEAMLNKVVSSVTGTLTTTAHSGNILITSGNVTVPTTAGFNCVLRAGGAHTVTFNATTSAAMASGDVMTLFVEDATTIHAVLTAAADKVSFT